MTTCRTWKKWISDDLDGALSVFRKKHLKEHLEGCEHCRAYAARLQSLRDGARDLAAEPVSPAHLRNLRESLKPRLAAAARDLQGGRPSREEAPVRRRWTWWAVGTLAAAAMLMILVIPPGDRQGPGEVYAFSLEEALILLSDEIGDDTVLEVSFNELLAAAFQNTSEDPDERLDLNPFESPLLWEGLTEEELKYLEGELKKEIKS